MMQYFTLDHKIYLLLPYMYIFSDKGYCEVLYFTFRRMLKHQNVFTILTKFVAWLSYKHCSQKKSVLNIFSFNLKYITVCNVKTFVQMLLYNPVVPFNKNCLNTDLNTNLSFILKSYLFFQQLIYKMHSAEPIWWKSS